MTNLEKKVINLTAPTRRGMKVTCTWDVPSACLKSDAKAKVRFDGLDMLWVFDAKKEDDTKVGKKSIRKGKQDVLARDATNKNSKKTDTETIPRKSFYPVVDKKQGKMPKLNNAEFWIRGYGNAGGGKKRYGPWVHKSLDFEVPAKPEVTLTYDPSTGRVTMSYKATEPDGAKERYDTECYLEIAGAKTVSGKAYTDLEKTVGSYEVPSGNNLAIGEWKKCVAQARNRGFAGASKYETATTYVFHPNPPVCGAPSLVYATQGVLETAMVRVPITSVGAGKDGSTNIRPTEITLQRLKNFTSSTDSAAAASASGWEDVDEDAGTTNGLSDTWADAVSDAGKFTWYRCVSSRNGYDTPGMPVQAACLNVAEPTPPSTGQARITSATSGKDGKSIVLALTGKESDDDGYEVSWSEDPEAWESTDPPSTFETAGTRLVVKGLEEGTEYTFKARAFDSDSDGNRTYGNYCNPVPATPYTTPSAVVLTGAGTTPRGSDLLLSWTYDTEAAQTQWRILDGSGKVRWSGKGASCAKLLKPTDYGSASSLSLRVEMTTGGGWARSQFMLFRIADPPTCELTAAATVTAQPIAFTVASDTGDDVRVALTALGSSGTGLYGDAPQNANDTVHSAVYSPDWAVANGVRTAEVALPDGLTLFDGATYRLDVTVTDAQTGLDSATESEELTINWAHKASMPTGSVTVDADARACTVTVQTPSDYAPGDRFDLYRCTADGERRIADGLPFGTSVTDLRAPFALEGADLHYMAVTRTADGDACMSPDIGYELPCGALRFDWGDQSVELPYDLQLSDDISKDSEVRAHMDGSRQAYWNEGWTRKASMTTNLIRFEDAEQQEALRSMLHYAGSVFVRTPDGMAFAADVQPGTIARDGSTSIVGVSINAVEHDLTDEDRPGKTDIAEPSWGGGAIEEHGGVIYDAAGDFPMDDWRFIGYADGTLYAYDPDGNVRDGSGAAMADWTWDGMKLFDENGDEVEVTEEP